MTQGNFLIQIDFMFCLLFAEVKALSYNYILLKNNHVSTNKMS